MKKNSSILLCIVIVLATAALFFLHSCKKNKFEPNVVVIVIDTLRADHLPFYGYTKETAPFLTEVASQSIIFDNAFAASSWTAPSTASIFTSLYPFQHGVTVGYLASKFHRATLNRIPAKIKTITEVLKEKGYKTYGVSDNINICEKMGFTQGFDRFKRLPYEDESMVNRQIEEWSREMKAQKKYFLYIHYNDCHTPLHKRPPFYREQADNLDDLIAQYDSEIHYVDVQIKKMFELFGWQENTLVIITADHGEELKERGRWGHGSTLYSEVIRVPFLMYFPGKERQHRRIKDNVSNIDTLPTVRNYLQIKSGETEAGVNLMPLIKGKKNTPDDRYIFSYLLKQKRKSENKKTIHRATVFKEWKSIYREKSRDSYKRELYNLFKDPGEKVNDFMENKSLASRLFIKYISFEKKCKKFKQETEDVKLDKKKMEELKSLGYVK